jgi:hypothetical protein
MAVAAMMVELVEHCSLPIGKQSFPQMRSRRICGGVGFEGRHNVDVAVRGFGIWTLLVRPVHQCLGDFALDTGEVETSLNLAV